MIFSPFQKSKIFGRESLFHGGHSPKNSGMGHKKSPCPCKILQGQEQTIRFPAVPPGLAAKAARSSTY